MSPKKDMGLFFLLQFDQQGAFIETVDKTGKNATFDYRQYSGVQRSIAKTIYMIRDRSHFTIDWENPESRLYLHEHPYLIPQLLESGIFINPDDEVIKAGAGTAQLRLILSKTSEQSLSSQLALITPDAEFTDFQFINEEHVWLAGSNIVLETQPVGALFHSLENFNLKNLPLADLQKFLSLFFSYLDNVTLLYESYTVQRDAEPIKSRPALIFEKVDADNSLYLRIGQLMPNTDVDFLDEYDLFRFAVINEMEETITVRPIEQVHVEQHLSFIEKTLNKHAEKGKKKSNNGIIQEENLLIIPENIASEFIYRDIPALIGQYALVGSEKLKSYKINVNPPKLNVQVGHGIDFLEGKTTLEFGDQKISLFDAINQFNKTRYIILADGSQALVNELYMQKLQRLFKKKKDKDKIEISFFDLPLVEELIEERAAKEQFSKARNIFEGFNGLADKKAKLPEINAKLRPYQQQGYKWLLYLHQNKLGGCLADDMGLGKTLQTITLLAEVYAKDKTGLTSIIAMPKSLLFNWENELKKFAPQLTFYTWYGTNRDKDEARKVNIILTTYAMVRNDIEFWKDEKFLYAILDESQAVKNLNSQLHKAVLLLHASYRLALSGTPVENNLSELYALFRFLNPAMFGSAEGFNHHYLTPIQKYDDKDATLALKKKIYPFILRRLKKDVLKELPDKIEQTLFVEMSPEQASYYEQRRLYYKDAIEQQVAMKGIQQSQFFVFQAMNELRQIASIPGAQTDGKIDSPKTELLIEQLEDAIANKHKVLVFANYLAAVEDIGEELDKRGIDFVTMTGSTRNRQQLVDRFQNDPDCRVFVLTLKTGGTGLNLTAADMVFIFDPWWNKSAENQAIDRAHRIGQDKKVMSYKLITLGTIEEKILKLQEVKSALLDAIISSDGASVKSLSEDDIAFILGK
ncbi:DEAD/DEAH box helicase [Dyadobacter sp. LHD-138]|uniref:DEAD/DEAH box helicase n=1 Tax=Dyadobacter sp. LHD-138 TaxID=3071413 RepID=UPI0027E06A48|nr:DEAD/DEAH box helicase [Dyadobacter sp. LHD-138]MDQ6480314.1 DEAD/DEAH box helicase [Dyadobacter sp. LHD-138]